MHGLRQSDVVAELRSEAGKVVYMMGNSCHHVLRMFFTYDLLTYSISYACLLRSPNYFISSYLSVRSFRMAAASTSTVFHSAGGKLNLEEAFTWGLKSVSLSESPNLTRI